MEVKKIVMVFQNQIIFTGLIDKSNFKNENELKSYTLAFFKEKVSKVIKKQ